MSAAKVCDERFCPFVRDCSFDCPAPGGDPQGTLVSAGGNGYGGASAGGLDSGRQGKIADESDPRDAPTSGGPAGTAEESDMATIPPPTPNVNPGGP
jgi:hypothetical protein